jgi:hypothetical protein
VLLGGDGGKLGESCARVLCHPPSRHPASWPPAASHATSHCPLAGKHLSLINSLPPALPALVRCSRCSCLRREAGLGGGQGVHRCAQEGVYCRMYCRMYCRRAAKSTAAGTAAASAGDGGGPAAGTAAGTSADTAETGTGVPACPANCPLPRHLPPRLTVCSMVSHACP